MATKGWSSDTHIPRSSVQAWREIVPATLYPSDSAAGESLRGAVQRTLPECSSDMMLKMSLNTFLGAGETWNGPSSALITFTSIFVGSGPPLGWVNEYVCQPDLTVASMTSWV